MTLVETIEKAVAVVGSQRELARLVGEREQHISDFKRGRPCSYQKHAQIAAVAGMEEEAIRILLQGIADSLSDKYPHEAQAKAALMAMLNAFPEPDSGGSEPGESGSGGAGSEGPHPARPGLRPIPHAAGRAGWP